MDKIIKEEIEKLQKEWEKEEKENIELEKARKKGKKIEVTEEEYDKNFDPTFCRYCMNYDDETDDCKAGITMEEWEKMDKEGEECDKYDYIYKIK